MQIRGRNGSIGRDPVRALADRMSRRDPPISPCHADRVTFALPCVHCHTFHGGHMRLWNRNASTAAADYDHPMGRRLTHLWHEVFESPELTGQTLHPPDHGVVVDVGGGLSLYGVELARLGWCVHTISGQNFYQGLRESIADDQDIWIDRQLVDLGGMQPCILVDIAEAFACPLPLKSRRVADVVTILTARSDVPTARLALRAWFTGILEALQTTPLKERLVRHTGFAQEILPTLGPYIADLVIDCYGALRYSVDRVHLVARYYEALRRGGTAWCAIEDIADTVATAAGERELFAWLASIAPTQFRVTTTGYGVRILRIQKTADPLPPILHRLYYADIAIPEERYANMARCRYALE